MTKYLNIFLLFILVGIVIYAGYFVWKKEGTEIKKITNIVVPQEKLFSIDPPPKQALVGNVTSTTGQIFWQSRTATQSAQVKDLKIVQQAELLGTGKDSSASLVFKDAVSINASSESQIEFLQTLPINFVFRQNNGAIIYEKNGTIPLSIRSLHLTMSVSNGKISLTTDMEKHIITLDVLDGSVKLGYNDVDYNTQTQVVDKGQRYIFDDDKREGTIEKIK